jgi:hypothetical protein
MATTTPNFGWAVPTSTDLVKDGAVAIETLGDAIDASLLDLKGGTTNQVLAKNSNTDMDFKWVSDATGMTNPMTTTGDTIYSSSGSTPARLGIGSTGQVLTVAGGVPTWATPAGGGGKVLQVVSTVNSTEVVVSSTTYTDTGITATITPTSSTSKILVLVAAAAYQAEASTTASFMKARLQRDATSILTQDRFIGVQGATGTVAVLGVTPVTYLDSPATTSATTYKLQGACVSTGSANFQVGGLYSSTITLLEIGA